MQAIAKAMQLPYPEVSCQIANMKDWDTATSKFKDASRNTSDLGRGRILIQSADQYRRFMSLLPAKDGQGNFDLSGAHKARLIPGSMSDYLKQGSEHGYAGSVNFDLEVAAGNGRVGRFEVQLVPDAYLGTGENLGPYDHSHALYDLIRIYKRMPKSFVTGPHKPVRNALITANSALFVEHGQRSGFIDLRKPQPKANVTEGTMHEVNTVLDMVRLSLENMSGRRFKWRTDLAEATTYAKTSLMHCYLSTPRHSSSRHTRDLDS